MQNDVNSFSTTLISLDYSDSLTQNHVPPSTLLESFDNSIRAHITTRDFSPDPFHPQVTHIQYSDPYTGPFAYPKPAIATNFQKQPLFLGSRFFHAMQEILDEIACFSLESFDQMSYYGGRDARRGISTVDFCDGLDGMDGGSMIKNNFMHGGEVEEKKKHMLALLQVVDDQYNQCSNEIHTVISSFHAITEFDPNIHSRFTLSTLSFVYKNLRNRIRSHILTTGSQTNDQENSFETSFIHKQLSLHQLSKRDHQLWKPQRGLPEKSVSVLRAWMFQNFLHPYPKDADKQLLAVKSGLTRSQVSNWFINARVRLWKPMIEEMYAEMNRVKTRRNEEKIDGTQRNNDHLGFDNRRFTMD